MEQAGDLGKVIYEGVLTVLYAIVDGVIATFHWLPADWPSWAKVVLMLAAGLFFLRFGETVLQGIVWLLLTLPLKLINRAWLLFKSPFGKSYWARRSELRREKMFKPGGLFLGGWGRSDLYHHGEGHFITIAAPGGGKTSAALIPSLLTAKSGSFILTDPKGENTAITRRHRENCSKVVYLNPFHADFEKGTGLTYPDSGFNPFDMIDKDENTRARADNFARFLCVTDRRESGSYFQDEGAELLSLFITWMVRHEPPENRNLPYLYELVRTDPQRTLQAMQHVEDSQINHDAERFAAMFETAPPQWQGVISKAQLATKRYVPGTPLARHTEKSGFDPRELKERDVTVYILLPSEHVQTGAPWLNMVIGLLGEAVGRPGQARPVTFLLDELPALGFLPDLRTQMRQYRAAGLRMWLFSQTTAALSDPEMYGAEGLKDLFGLCDTKQFFSIAEYEVASQISHLCGETSRLNRTQQGRTEDTGYSTVGIPLIRPDEILKLKKNQQIIVRKGLPIRARLVPYFKRIKWRWMTDKNPYRSN